MQIDQGTRAHPKESIVPMINVVFLLLIFFLMTSQLSPPDPVDISTPVSSAGLDPRAQSKLFLDEEGLPHFQNLIGDAAFLALTREDFQHDPLLLSADRNLEAVKLAAILRRLAEIGIAQVELQVNPQ